MQFFGCIIHCIICQNHIKKYMPRAPLFKVVLVCHLYTYCCIFTLLGVIFIRSNLCLKSAAGGESVSQWVWLSIIILVRGISTGEPPQNLNTTHHAQFIIIIQTAPISCYDRRQNYPYQQLTILYDRCDINNIKATSTPIVSMFWPKILRLR
jgi:hypothetical protein